MKKVASTDEYTIFQRRDGRYAVKDADGNAVNGDDKVKVLLAQDLIKAPAPKAPEPEPEPEEAAAPAEDEAAEEATAEEAAAEEAESEAEAPAEDGGEAEEAKE